MAVSTIALIAYELPVLQVASFYANGVPYVAWTTPAPSGNGGQVLWWKPHTSGNFTEVMGSFSGLITNITCCYRPSNGTIVFVFDQDPGPASGNVGPLYEIIFNATTGAVVQGLTKIATGMKPQLNYRGGIAGDDMLLTYANRADGSIYLRESLSGGVTWSRERPVLNNTVLATENTAVVPYDSEHLSILQVGNDSRGMLEIGSLVRTRPLATVVAHPTIADRYFVGEPSQNATDLSDNTRGVLLVKRDGSGLLQVGGSRLGVSDSVGNVALLNTAGVSASVVASATGGQLDGRNLTPFSLVPAAGSPVTLPGTQQEVVSADLSSAFVYFAHHSDTTSNVDELTLLRLSDNATATISTGLQGARAVAVANLTTPVIFMATNESGVEKLRVYTENGLSPTLQATFKMPARVNDITTLMTGASAGILYVSMVDRLNVYKLNGFSNPLRLFTSLPLVSGRGQFRHSALTPAGNIVAAMGQGGVGIFNPITGQSYAQFVPSSIIVPFWLPNTFYALNTLVQPSPQNFYAGTRAYFNTTSAGTSGLNEPSWSATGTVVGDGPNFQQVGLIDSVVTQVIIDETRKRIYAVGLTGGTNGVGGRLWSLTATGLV